ncbi:MAG: extracellular solute-binding protein [Candidatus Doudnabacteria bacterium]
MEKKYYILGGVLILLLILAGVLFFFTGSKPTTPKNNGKVTLVWWKTFEDTENVQDLINDYQTANKNVSITFVKKDPSDYEQQLVNAIAAGTGPDIFSIHNDWLPKHQDKITPAPDSLMNVRSYKDNFVDVSTSDFVKDNKIYAVPLAVDLLVLYYNKDILGSSGISQPPATWPELVADVQKITKVDSPGTFSRSGIALGTSSNVSRAVDILNLLMLQNGTNFYSPDFNSATFDQTLTLPNSSESFNPGATALAFYTQFANPAKVSYTWNAKSNFSIDAFTQGKVAMMLGYQYMEPMVRSKAPTLNWDVSGIPQVSTTATKVNFANYWGETVSKSSKNTAAAWDFLNFITSKQELTKYYAKHKLVASRKDILPFQILDTDLGAFAENALTARSVYKKDANLFEGVFAKMIDDVILRNFQPQEALGNAVQQINLNLQNK